LTQPRRQTKICGLSVRRIDGDRSSALPDKKIRFDDFELDYGRFQLSRGGAPVRLEGLPLQLLMFMVEKRGQLVTRDQISCELWSKDVFVDVEQGINTAIRKVRRALGDDADDPQYLQTVVGRGYRFVAPQAEEDSIGQLPAEKFAVSAEELGRAIMSAAGLDPENPRATPKSPVEE
jgi:DNA-binding winged helix-turn-helix (wHTH) protein